MPARYTMLIATCFLAALASGCTVYRFGACSLYRPDVQTVHVPVIKSSSFRRNLGEQLTEQVVKEIESSTPYKVVDGSNPDSVLEINIDSDTKRIFAENGLDEPRNLEQTWTMHMTWRDRRGNLITRSAMPLDDTVVSISQTANITPEVGQSITTGHQEIVQRLATQIVSQMEAGW